MSEETLEVSDVVASLMESNDCLREEIARLRNQNRILRRVHSAMRSALTSLRAQVALAQENDELFKKFCQGEFDAQVATRPEGGLPEGTEQVEPTA